MIEFLKSLFRSDPKKKILEEIERKYKVSVELQRNGKLREYGSIMKEIEDLQNTYVRIKEDEG